MALASEIPTVDEFVTRFPQFDGQDEVIEVVIPEAPRDVGDNWIVTDQKPAIMYLTAHLMTVEALALAGGGGGAARGSIVAESFGPMSTSYANPNGSGGDSSMASSYMRTEYGKRYYQIARRNTPDVSVVGGDNGDCNPWAGWFG